MNDDIARAIGAVLIQRGHQATLVSDWVAKHGDDWAFEVWEEYFGPAVDDMAGRMGLPPFPEE